jgi:hypothetical protein
MLNLVNCLLAEGGCCPKGSDDLQLGVKVPKKYDFEFWWAYVQFCRQLSKKCVVSMRVLDRALWQYSKEIQR